MRPLRATRVDLNTASHSDLAALPGLSSDDADRIIAGRPYKKKVGLLRKKILSQKKFDAVTDSVYVDHDGK